MTPDTLLEDTFRLVATQKKALKKLGIFTIRDILFYFPRSYGVMPHTKHIKDLKKNDMVLVCGKITKIEKTKAFRKKMSLTRAVIEDMTGSLRVVWFHQPYIATMIKKGSIVSLKGKITGDKQGLYLANPDQEKGVAIRTGTFGSDPTHASHATLQPTYSETRGITSRWFYYALKKIFEAKVHELIEDPVPKIILSHYNLPSLKTALMWIHEPRKNEDALVARKRFSFEEVFFIQLERLKARKKYRKNDTFPIVVKKDKLQEFIHTFPFTLTSSQEKAIGNVCADFKKGVPMSRLLEGDVGSGKTAVAAITSYAVATSRPEGQDFGNLQVAYMAPTEILAKQHFESFMGLFSNLPIQIGLITGSGAWKFPSKVNPKEATTISRPQLLKWVRNGEIPILIGTHALIQKKVGFENLAYVVIDEQHRFGTMQRYALTQKEKRVPHLLSMTATPIPRTLALTVYGDLDLTLLDEMPPGRKPIITHLVLKGAREDAYKKTKEEIESGRQAYVICPRIDEPDPKKRFALNVKSVKEEATRLKKDVFPKYSIEILHSKMRPKEKEEVMQRFLDKKIQILVATSVVEVGVNVPNATIILIEGADRFGLAQLHQLRGRVLRSTHQAYCFIFTDSKSANTKKRLEALMRAKNGFELAEHDLELRGSGELYGRVQWGLSDVGMEAIKNIKMVEVARAEAQDILKEDAELKKYPLLAKCVKERASKIHFE